jgi:hypothetical protein
MMDDDERGPIDGMIGRGNQSTGRKPVPVPLCPPQIPHDLTRALAAARFGYKRYGGNEYTRNKRRIVKRHVLYAINVV